MNHGFGRIEIFNDVIYVDKPTIRNSVENTSKLKLIANLELFLDLSITDRRDKLFLENVLHSIRFTLNKKDKSRGDVDGNYFHDEGGCKSFTIHICFPLQIRRFENP